MNNCHLTNSVWFRVTSDKTLVKDRPSSAWIPPSARSSPVAVTTQCDQGGVWVVSNKRDTIRWCDAMYSEMHFCWETNIESEKSYDGSQILNCPPMIIFTDSVLWYLFNNRLIKLFFPTWAAFRRVFTSTEAEPDITFRLKAPGILSPEPDMWPWHGAVEGALWHSTVFCLGSLSLVSFSPMLAWRNQGREILRLVLPPAFGGLLGLVTVAMMGLCLMSRGLCVTAHAGPLSQSHLCSPLHSPLSTSHRCHQTLKAIFPVIVASTKTFSPSTKFIRGRINIPDQPQ